ncbi:MAG: hypothetical protein J6112_01355 [Clostridia bacterium]|nr:hypothetical protein [Clostridia bacterium]
MKRIASILVIALLTVFAAGITVSSASGDPSLVIGNVDSDAGETFSLKIGIKDNPGIISLRITVAYSDVLELVDVKDLGLLSGYTVPAPTIKSPYTLRWTDSLALENNSVSGDIAELTFKVKDNTPDGAYKITLDTVEVRNFVGERLDFGSAQAYAVIGEYEGEIPVDNGDDHSGVIPGTNPAANTPGEVTEITDDGNTNGNGCGGIAFPSAAMIALSASSLLLMRRKKSRD